jgi:hypothetical protein
VKYGYLILAIFGFAVGCYVGSYFFPRTELREVPVRVVETQAVTRTVEKLVAGEVTERVIEKTVNTSKVSSQPKKQTEYRVGVLLPVASELQLPTVTAGRRLYNNLWIEAEYNIKHKEALIGLSYEF